MGANNLTTFVRITLPLSLPGIVHTTLLCFTIAINMFVTPRVLGGGFLDFVSNLVYDSTIVQSNYPFGSACAFVLLIVSFIFIFGVNRLFEARLGRLRV